MLMLPVTASKLAQLVFISSHQQLIGVKSFTEYSDRQIAMRVKLFPNLGQQTNFQQSDARHLQVWAVLEKWALTSMSSWCVPRLPVRLLIVAVAFN